MKKLFALVSFILFFCSYIKASDLIIELIPDSTLSGLNFSCLKVIDARDNKASIGFVSRGFSKNDTKIIFPKEFKDYLEITFEKILPKKEENAELVLIFRNLIVSENIGTMNQYAYCNVEIEFARQTDTTLYSLGIFHSNISEKGNNVKYSHSKRVLQALEDCFRKFDKSDWKTNNGNLIQNIETNNLFDYKNIPSKGVYLNYSQMIRKSSLDNINFDIIKNKETNKFVSYEIDFKGEVNPELVQFVSDGNSLYINIGTNEFIQSTSYGNYIYFQGKIPITITTEIAPTIYLINVTGAGLTGAFLGIVGSAFLTYDSFNSTTKIDTSIKGVVLNTEKGIIKPLTDYYLVEIARDYPELLQEYRASKRELADKENLIIKLNSKF